MPKKVDDIVVTERRKSIRDVPLPEHRHRRASDHAEHDIDPVRVAARPHKRKRSIPTSRRIWIVLGATLLVLFLLVLSFFDGATLSYTSKSTSVTYEGDTYQANKTAESGVLFSVIKLSGEKGVEVPASGAEVVERKASGTIVVYNKNSSSQRLVANTRFEAPDGKIYRALSAVTVPGQKTVSGVVQPGSVEATVAADVAGAEYNKDLVDFTIPGFKGTPNFTNVYARSKTPMAGGFVGEAPSISEEHLEEARVKLEEDLRNDLAIQASAQVPSDFIIFPSLSSTTFNSPTQTQDEDGGARVSLSANFYGVMFKKSDLSRFLASDKVTLMTGDVVEIANLDNLNFSFAGEAPPNLLSASSINFEVNGTAMVVWQTDEAALKSDLAGRHEDEVVSILTNYPSIISADAVIRPFWKNAFPEDASLIQAKELPLK